MKIVLDFERENHHSLRGNSCYDAPASHDVGAS